MNKNRLRSFRLLALRRSALWLSGGLLPVLSLGSCTPEARNAVLGGIQVALTGLFNAMIEGLVLSLQAATGDGGAQTTVVAVFKDLTTYLA